MPWSGLASAPIARKRGIMLTFAHGEGARALHDGGSQLNLVSQRWATKNGLATPAGDTLSITLGNGQQTTCSGQLTLKLQLQSFKDAIPCHIMKLPEQYDVILGDALSPANWVAEQIVRCATRDQSITLCIEPR